VIICFILTHLPTYTCNASSNIRYNQNRDYYIPISPRNSYAIFKAFDAFKKRNKRTGHVRSILSYFPFRIVFPPALFSVGVVPLLKMFTTLRIGVDMAFTVYYVAAISIHVLSMNESTIKQYTQLRLAEEVMFQPGVSTTISQNNDMYHR
jgi:hypothetical protein